MRGVAAELREIARLLRSGNAALRGVAHVESLLTSGESPLYGVQVELLRDELGRARFLLAGTYIYPKGEPMTGQPTTSSVETSRKENRFLDWDSKDVGTKDLIIGFGIMGSMAVVAIALGIILSL